MKLREDKAIVIVAILSALLIASHENATVNFGGVVGSYIYWLIRIAIQAAFYIGAWTLIERYGPKSLSNLLLLASAILVSHIPFVLAITALDIVLGFPELGIDSAAPIDQSRFVVFGFELIYLLDNHFIVCILISLPRFYFSELNRENEEQSRIGSGTFLSTLEPPLLGSVLWVEAQEHYVRITTDQESRMVLARFSDIVRELESQEGMQVHRSHWVARDAIVKQEKVRQGITLFLTTGDTVPVSRSFKKRLDEL